MNIATDAAYVGRFRKLADEETDRNAFRRELLDLIVRATDASTGRTWNRDAESRWLPADGFGLRRADLNAPASQAAPTPANLEAVRRRRQTLYVDSASTTSVLHPIEPAGDSIVELTFAEAGPLNRRRIGEVLAVAHAAAERHAAGDERRRIQRRLEHADRLRSLSTDLLACDDSKAVAYTLANDGRVLAGADRVSVWLRSGRGFRLEAISGQEVVRERTDLIEAMARVVFESLTGVKPTAPAVIRLDSQSTDAQSADGASWPSYRRRYSVNAMLVTPLVAKGSDTAGAGEITGAIVVEFLEASPVGGDAPDTLAEIARDGARALALHAPARRRPARILRRRRRMAAFLLAIAVLPWAIYVPADISCPGVLQPVERRHVFAPAPGVVEQVHVAAGDRVVAGQVLVELSSVELETEITRLYGETAACEERLKQLCRKKIAERGPATNEQIDSVSEAAELEEKIASLRRQSAVREAERAGLKIVAPTDGTVSTSDLRELLNGRPVARGQILLTVCRLDGPWRLELRVPESEGGRLAGALDGGAEVGVTFSPASDPFVDHQARLRTLPPVARSTPAEGTVLLVDAECLPGRGFDDGAPYEGGEVAARIHAGSESIGGRMFGGIARVIRHRILFRWF